MLKDSQLAKVAMIMSIAGIIGIYFLANIVGPENREISSITKIDVGKQVILNGTVVSSRITNGNLFLVITDYKKNLTIVMFERDLVEEVPAQGDEVTVVGQVNEYKSLLEVIAKKVIKWNS